MPTFVDTNILVYPFDAQEPGKQAVAARRVAGLIASGEIVVSTQVVQEVFATLRRKFEVRLGADRVDAIVHDIAAFRVVQVDVPIILAATGRVRRESISFWDALIVEAALRAGATRLLTEDLRHGQVVDGRLRIENPFLVGR